MESIILVNHCDRCHNLVAIRKIGLKHIKWHSKKTRDNKIRFRISDCYANCQCNYSHNKRRKYRGFSDPYDIFDNWWYNSRGYLINSVGKKYQENWILYRTSSELLKKRNTFLKTAQTSILI
jgi:hypothetical protein